MPSRTPKTRLLHPDASVPQGFKSLATPVFRGSTTLFDRAAAIRDTWNHDDAPYTYGSYGTPTTLELAARVAELEGARRCFITPGGQAALVLVYVACLDAGDHVLVPETVYRPSRAFADRVLRRLGVDVEYYQPGEGQGIASRIRERTRLVWCESPGSITMDVQDVPAIAAAAHARGVIVALDNTWAAGVLFEPFGHGVDISVQALTKYVGGHSDLLLGSVSVRDEALYQRLGVTHQDLGMTASPDDCCACAARPADAPRPAAGHRSVRAARRRLARVARGGRDRAASGASVLCGTRDVEARLHGVVGTFLGGLSRARFAPRSPGRDGSALALPDGIQLGRRGEPDRDAGHGCGTQRETVRRPPDPVLCRSRGSRGSHRRPAAGVRLPCVERFSERCSVRLQRML